MTRRTTRRAPVGVDRKPRTSAARSERAELDHAAELFIEQAHLVDRFNAAVGDEATQAGILHEFVVTAVLERTRVSARSLEVLALLFSEHRSSMTWLSAARRIRAQVEDEARAQLERDDRLRDEFSVALKAVARPAPPTPEGAELVEVVLLRDERGAMIGRRTALKVRP